MNFAEAILIMAPHPDDEILGCGNLMQQAHDYGANIIVAWLTDGGASHGKITDDNRARLVAIRQAEARAGLAALGVSATMHFLGFPDGELAAHEQHARERLQVICREAAVGTVFVTSATDSHPDHCASFRIAVGLHGVDLFEYPVSARYDGVPAEAPNAISIAVTSPAKRAALACHSSQSAAGGACYPLTAAAIDRFCLAPELFVPIGNRR